MKKMLTLIANFGFIVTMTAAYLSFALVSGVVVFATVVKLNVAPVISTGLGMVLGIAVALGLILFIAEMGARFSRIARSWKERTKQAL